MNAKWYGIAPLVIGSMVIAMSASAAARKSESRATRQIVSTGNSAPVRDSRGTLVISGQAIAPEGSNPALGVISPIRDPRIVFAPRASTRVYRRCSKEVTDFCSQFWEPPKDLPNCPGDPDCPQTMRGPGEWGPASPGDDRALS